LRLLLLLLENQAQPDNRRYKRNATLSSGLSDAPASDSGLKDASKALSAGVIAYLTGMGVDLVTGTAVTLFCGLPSMILSE
jgi:hypothetical protein